MGLRGGLPGDGEFRLAAGHGRTCHRGLEPVSGDPVQVPGPGPACPAAFQDPVFRALTAAGAAGTRTPAGEAPWVVVTFEADAPKAAP